MADYLILIPLFPLLAFAINILLGRWFIKEKTAWIASLAVFGSWVVSVLTLREVHATGEVIQKHLYTWIPAGSFNIPVVLYVDQLTAVMIVTVSTVSFLVHVYSIGYMHGDPGFYRFFSYLPFFVFSMLMLVLADNYLVLFVFWEAVGLCSYLLIGFWYRRRSASNAAKKAFVVNRVGDVGFGLGIMLTFWTFGSLNFYGSDGIFARAPEIATGTMTAIALLLFTGAIGKSAQFPLHVWLPDAMEGPTPVSALIHAATMVTAGIYMVARSHAFFMQSTTAMFVVATIGVFTAFMAATIAVVQHDIKKVVAYSTVSQLGYMAFALGTGAWAAGIFHLMTHAFFKGLLFLGCGSVIHGMHDEQDMRYMGGLRKYMPITFITFLVGGLANAGVVPFAGFWSKDETMVGAWTSTIFPFWGKVVAVVAMLAAFLTALYMFRLIFLTFMTKSRFESEHVHPHESSSVMTIPLILLAIPAAIIGFVGFPPENGAFHRFIEPVFSTAPTQSAETASLYTIADTKTDDAVVLAAEGEEGHHVSTQTTLAFGTISTIVALSGILLAYLLYITNRISAHAIAQRYSGIYQFLVDKWRMDIWQDHYVVRPARWTATMLWQVVDIRIIDGSVNGLASLVKGSGQRLRHMQTGLVANYALAIALGMVVIIGVYLAAFSNLFR